MAKFDELPTRDLAAEDYVLIQSEGGPTSRTQFSAKSAEDLGLVTKEDVATSEKAGIVKPDGTTTKVSEDGTLSVDSPTVPIATANDPGIMYPDGMFFTVNEDGKMTPNSGTFLSSLENYLIGESWGSPFPSEFASSKAFVDALVKNSDFVTALANNQSFIDALVVKLPIVSTETNGLAPQIPEA